MCNTICVVEYLTTQVHYYACSTEETFLQDLGNSHRGRNNLSLSHGDQTVAL